MTGPYIHEQTLQVPAGFTVGDIVPRPGRNYRYVIRNRDDKAALCPVTPAPDECLPMSEMRRELNAILDEMKE